MISYIERFDNILDVLGATLTEVKDDTDVKMYAVYDRKERAYKANEDGIIICYNAGDIFFALGDKVIENYAQVIGKDMREIYPNLGDNPAVADLIELARENEKYMSNEVNREFVERCELIAVHYEDIPIDESTRIVDITTKEELEKATGERVILHAASNTIPPDRNVKSSDGYNR